jgi:hypothetical protein
VSAYMSDDPVDITRLVTIDQLVERYPFLTPRWVRTLVARQAGAPPKLPCRRLGGRILIDPADLEALLHPRPPVGADHHEGPGPQKPEDEPPMPPRGLTTG